MDGWGNLVKSPYTSGDPYTGISRMYLKFKSQLMPYIYTSAASASNIDTGNGDEGLPMIRAMFLYDDSDYAASTATQYQYLFGDSFLVAPVYQDTAADDAGNDIRNNIYLPGDADKVWIDYFTGEQYSGGQVLNNFDAPLWKLPLFVKGNAIIPMYEPNNNPVVPSDTNPEGLDKTRRTTEFFAIAGDGSYTSYEDDGASIKNDTDESDGAYGTIDNISYGDHVSTSYSSHVGEDGTATFTIDASTGGYDGYDSNRASTFVVNVSQEPDTIVARNGDAELTQIAVSSKDEFDAVEPAASEAVVFYDEAPNLNATPSDEDFSNTEITTTPKLYVKFAMTDVQQNAQILTLTGFVNDGEISADTLNEHLDAPENLTDTSSTPTSISLAWDEVRAGESDENSESATSYELLIDGQIFNVGSATDFVHEDLAYNSTHTYQVRARNANGYSVWSPEQSFASKPDPWRNAPVPVAADWDGGYYSNSVESRAFDHSVDDNLFHTDSNAIGHALTLDYGSAYEFNTFEYYPRANAGNGTVTKMKIETSLDGNHWAEQTVEWEKSSDVKTVDLGTHFSSRYVKLTPLASVGGYFSASELAFYKKDGTSGYEVGPLDHHESVTDTDYGNLSQVIGKENRDPHADDFKTNVSNRSVDFNGNGVYDVYDLSFTMTKLDGGTQKKGEIGGELAVIPSSTAVKVGDVITVDLYADGVQNANALGALVNFNSSQFEFVAGSVAQSPHISGMENRSIAVTDFTDGMQTVNLAFANRGDKALYNGSGMVASFQLRAKADGDVALPSTTYLVGPGFDYVEDSSDGSVEFPDVPEPTAAEYAQDAFDITMTNDERTTDDGTNVTKLIQQKSYAGLFDGGETTNDFEFLWDTDVNRIDGELPSYVTLPTTLRFSFKEPSKLDNVQIVNRPSGNGSVATMKATITFEDGTTQEFAGGDFDTRQSVYTLPVDESNKDKLVTNVNITPLAAAGTAAGDNPSNRMLTLREINFNYITGVDEVTGVRLGDNATSIYVGDLAPVTATVLPDTIDFPYFTVTSSDDSIASVTQAQSGDDVLNFVRGNAPGIVTITVASVLDSTKSASYELMVNEGVDVSALQAALHDAAVYSRYTYTEESYAALADAVQVGTELLASDEYTATDIAAATGDIRNAIDALVVKPLNEANLINTSADTDVTVIDATSEAGFEGNAKENVLDYDNGTLWHSDYLHSAGLPQSLTFDLGDTYDLTDVTFIPRQSNGKTDVLEVNVYVAANGDSEGLTRSKAQDDDGYTLLGTYTFEGGDGVSRAIFRRASFAPTAARYVRFEVTKDVNPTAASLSEIRFYGTKHEEPAPVAKDDLQVLVDKITDENLAESDYTADSWTPFENALADAQRLLDTDDATQAEVDAATTALQAARDELIEDVAPPVENPDKSALQGLISKVSNLSAAGKPDGVVAEYRAALTNALAVLANGDATQVQINDAHTRLSTAASNLVAAPVEVDKSDLQPLIDVASNMSTEGMPADLVTEFQDALENAKAALADDDATEDEVNAAFVRLQKVMNEILLAGGGTDNGDGTNGGNGDNGGYDNGGGSHGGAGNKGDTNNGGKKPGVPNTGDATSLPLIIGIVVVGIAAVGAGIGLRLRNSRTPGKDSRHLKS